MPDFGADSFGVCQAGEECGEHELAVRWELQCLTDGVEDPAEDELSHGPAAVALEGLLEGDRFVALLGGHAWCSEDLVDGVEQMVPEGVEPFGTALTYLDEVVHEDVGVAQRALEHAV